MTLKALLPLSQPEFIVDVPPSGDPSGATDVGNVQAAIDSLKGVGGRVSLGGTYTFGGPSGVSLYPGIGLQGAGPLGVGNPAAGTAYLKAAAGFNAAFVTMKRDPGNSSWASFPWLSQLAILGSAGNANQHGVVVDGVNGSVLDIFMDQVLIFSTGGDGVRLSDTPKLWMDKCYLEHCAGFGFNANGNGAELRMTGAYIFGNTGIGCDFTSMAHVSLLASHIASNPAGGIQAGSLGSGLICNDCFFSDNGTHGGAEWMLHLGTVNGATVRALVQGNQFKDTRGASAVNNHVMCGDLGAVKATITDNTFVGQQADAILRKFNNAGDNYIIRNNQGFNDTKARVTNPVNTVQNTIGLTGSTATVVASTDYTVQDTDVYLTSSAGTGVSITIKDSAGNTVNTPGATFAGVVPIGYKVNFGAFSVAPTLTSSVV